MSLEYWISIAAIFISGLAVGISIVTILMTRRPR